MFCGSQRSPRRSQTLETLKTGIWYVDVCHWSGKPFVFGVAESKGLLSSPEVLL